MLELEPSTTSVGDLGSPNADEKKQEKRKEEAREKFTMENNDRDCCNGLLNNRASSG